SHHVHIYHRFKPTEKDLLLLYNSANSAVKSLKEYVKLPEERELTTDMIPIEPNFYCFMTMTDTTKTGGYMFKPHRPTGSLNLSMGTCTPPYVIANVVIETQNQESTDKIKKKVRKYFSSDEDDDENLRENSIKCPHCGTYQKIDEMDIIPSKLIYDTS